MKKIEKSEIMENEIQKLSQTIVEYAIKVKENDRVLITYESVECHPLVKVLVKKIVEQKGIPFIRYRDPEMEAYLIEHTKENRINEIIRQKEYEVDHFDCFISIRYNYNDYEGKDADSNILKQIGELSEKIDSIRTNQRRWTLLNYPSTLDAYKAHMKTEQFKEYAFHVMNVDYQKMDKMVQPLKELMEKTDMVHMIGPNTDITFSIKGMNAVPCCGTSNIPDGEVFTAPVKDSVNGTITFNTPCSYRGFVFHNVSLTFENGKIIKATCDQDEERLNEIFDTDLGARYVGEFSFGLNPEILEPMGDILYDEKIIGSIHFTPGRCYEDADNGNHSSIHWDMIWVQRKEYGGGEVYFDETLIRKDGIFVLEELADLNYHLK